MENATVIDSGGGGQNEEGYESWKKTGTGLQGAPDNPQVMFIRNIGEKWENVHIKKGLFILILN